jgi:hypothetical protein
MSARVVSRQPRAVKIAEQSRLLGGRPDERIILAKQEEEHGQDLILCRWIRRMKPGALDGNHPFVAPHIEDSLGTWVASLARCKPRCPLLICDVLVNFPKSIPQEQETVEYDMLEG